MKYKFRPGVAALLEVTVSPWFHAESQSDASRVYDCIYMKEGDIQAFIPPGTTVDHWHELPEPVRERVRAHFSAVFALPVEKRGAYLKQSEIPIYDA